MYTCILQLLQARLIAVGQPSLTLVVLQVDNQHLIKKNNNILKLVNFYFIQFDL